MSEPLPADHLHEVRLFAGFVTTMTDREIRDLIDRLRRILAGTPSGDGDVEGVIRNYSPDLRHGFVRPDGDGPDGDVFFHRDVVEGACDADLVRGRRVRFAVGTDPRPRYEGRPRVTRLVLV